MDYMWILARRVQMLLGHASTLIKVQVPQLFCEVNQYFLLFDPPHEIGRERRTN